jgi:hypothetical protein
VSFGEYMFPASIASSLERFKYDESYLKYLMELWINAQNGVSREKGPCSPHLS